jgi:hypothetical protein
VADSYDVLLGLDVGKGEHHGIVLAADGSRQYDAAMPNSEPKLREVFDQLARQGRLLVVVDQSATIGAAPGSRSSSVWDEVAYLSGLAMRHIADLYPGNAKTDARDAYVDRGCCSDVAARAATCRHRR